MITALSAITLATRDMEAAVRFYRLAGFELLYGGEGASFTSFRAGDSFLNLIAEPAEVSWWGRAIFYESDVDGLYARLVDEYELNERAGVLKRKLDVIVETAHALTDIIDADRATRLEAAIVVLIVLELIAALVQIALALHSAR